MVTNLCHLKAFNPFIASRLCAWSSIVCVYYEWIHMVLTCGPHLKAGPHLWGPTEGCSSPVDLTWRPLLTCGGPPEGCSSPVDLTWRQLPTLDLTWRELLTCGPQLNASPHLWTSPVDLTCGPHLKAAPHLWTSPEGCSSPVDLTWMLVLTCGPPLWTSPVDLTWRLPAPHLWTSPEGRRCSQRGIIHLTVDDDGDISTAKCTVLDQWETHSSGLYTYPKVTYIYLSSPCEWLEIPMLLHHTVLRGYGACPVIVMIQYYIGLE